MVSTAENKQAVDQYIPRDSGLSFAKTLRATEFHFLTMLQACSQGVYLKVNYNVAEGVSRKGRHVQLGGRAAGVKVRSPLAWGVSVEETKRMRPTDKAIFKDGES